FKLNSDIFQRFCTSLDQTFTVDATLNVAPFCIHRINFKLYEKKILSNFTINHLNFIRIKITKIQSGKLSLSSEGPKHVLPTKTCSNQYIGGTKDVSASTIYRTCFGPSELKLWSYKMIRNLEEKNY
ncbi:hypothetical protein BpHYR1_045262, partial [Brachionus plicatilis]